MRCQDCGRRFCPKAQGTLYDRMNVGPRGVRAVVTRTIHCRACFGDGIIGQFGPVRPTQESAPGSDFKVLIDGGIATFEIAVDVRGDEESYSATVLPDEGSFWRSIGLRPDDELEETDNSP